jgi:branched-chain amino acid transport system permease protein
LSSYLLHIVIIGLWLAYLASAWNLVGGFAGQHSLGHALFVGIGAYASTLLFIHLGLSPWLGSLAGALAAGLVAWLIGFLSFRYGIKGPYFFLATIAFAEVGKILVSNIAVLGGASGLAVPMRGQAPVLFQFDSKYPYLAVMGLLLAAVLALSARIRRSGFGLALLALRENEAAARASGVAAERSKITALVLSAMLCALGGSFYAQYTLFVEPQSMFGMGLSLEIVLFAIVGGIGTVFGPAIGALALYAVAEVTRHLVSLGQSGNFHLIVYALILVVVVMFFPEGLAGAWRRRRSRGPSVAAPTAESAAAPRPREAGRPSRPPGPAVLEINAVTKRFGGLTALSGVDLQVARGECLGLIGPNGSGKSTLLNVIAGVYPPEQGQVLLAGRPISGLHPEQICRAGIGRTFQIAQPFGDLSVRENVMVGAFSRTRNWQAAARAADPVLDALGLAPLASTRTRLLTTARRKKVEIARALATRPQVLLLDEALAGLTEQETAEMIGFLLALRSAGTTLIVVEHIMRVVSALCDRVLFLNFGQAVTQGGVQAVLNHPEVIRIYLGGEPHAGAAGG